MRKYYIIIDSTGNMVSTVEERFEDELSHYFKELSEKGYTIKKVSSFQHHIAERAIWEQQYNPDIVKDIRMVNLVTSLDCILPLLLFIMVVINLLTLI